MNSEALNTPPPRLFRGSARRILPWVDMCLLIPFFSAAGQQSPPHPTWWETRSVLKHNTVAVDYAAANQGQLKNFARAARDEMLVRHLIETGDPIDQMVNAWSSNTSRALDYSVANLGQLKAVATLFYDQLILLGLRDYYLWYPWSDYWWVAKDYAATNLGQLKNMFAFEIPEADLLEYAPGHSARFWRPYSDNGLVSSGIVAGDQSFQNSFPNGINPTVRLKGGTSVSTNQHGVILGILAEDQRLKYRSDKDAVFKAGSQVEFKWNGFVVNGTLAADQGGDQFVYTNAIDKVRLKAGAAVSFGWNNDYCYLGTLAADQPVKYNSTDSAVFKDGTEIEFSGLGYARRGALFGNQSVKYNSTDSVLFKDGTEIEFSELEYARRGTLSGNQSVKYNSTDSVRFKDGTEIQFSDKYVLSGTLHGNQPVPVKYNANEVPATFKDGTEIQFWDGYVWIGILGGNQSVKYNEHGDNAAFQDGTEIQFSDKYVLSGTLHGNDPVPVKYNANEAPATFKDGSGIQFLGGYVSQGILGGNQDVKYNADDAAMFQDGTDIEFSNEYVAQGTLSADQAVKYDLDMAAVFKGGTHIWFTWPGYVNRGTLAVDQSLDYRFQQSAVFKGGAEAGFSHGKLSQGVLARAQPLYYSDTQTRLYPLGQLLYFDTMMGVPYNLPEPLAAEDSDFDGLSDFFEMNVFGSLHETPGSDFNSNGGSNQAEIAFWTAYCGAVGVDLLSDINLNQLTTLEELMLGVHSINAFITFLTPNTLDSDGDGVPDAKDPFPFDPAPLVLSSTGAPPVIQLDTPAAAQLVP